MLMLAGLFLFTSVCIGQDYIKDIEKITGTFKKGDISYRMKYCFYPADSIKKVSDSMDIYCCRSGQDYYCRVTSGKKSYEYCKNSKYFFVVDNPESAIVVKKSPDAGQQAWDISKVDSLIHTPGVKVLYKGLDNSFGEYDITISGGTWDRLRIVFNKTDYTLEKMYMLSSFRGKMYGAEINKPMVVIYFSGYNHTKLDKNIFSEGTYFSNTPSGLVLSNSYRKYKLLDYTHNNPNE